MVDDGKLTWQNRVPPVAASGVPRFQKAPRRICEPIEHLFGIH